MASVCVTKERKKANEKEEEEEEKDMNPNNSLNFKITPKAGGRWLRWVCDWSGGPSSESKKKSLGNW